MSRRRVLAAVGGLVGIAGCNGASEGDGEPTDSNVTAAPVPTARAGRVRTVVAFDGAGPANLAVVPSGDIYLAMSLSGAIRRLPAAQRTATGLTGAATERVAALPAGTGGVFALDVLDGTVYAALDSGERPTHGVWQVPVGGGEPRQVAALDPQLRLRGLLADGDRDRLYVTHAQRGVVATIDLDDGTAVNWLTHRLLGADGRGATGLARVGQTVYVTNYARGRVVRATVQPTGTASLPTVVAESVALSGAAGLTRNGRQTYVAAAGLNRIVRVDSTGTLRRLATGADGLNVPTDVALGPDGDALFVTNFGFKPGVGLTGERSLLRVAI